MTQDSLVVAGKNFSSRLLVGTGKYKDEAEAIASIEASGAEIVTVAVRRIDLQNEKTLQFLITYLLINTQFFLILLVPIQQKMQ